MIPPRGKLLMGQSSKDVEENMSEEIQRALLDSFKNSTTIAKPRTDPFTRQDFEQLVNTVNIISPSYASTVSYKPPKPIVHHTMTPSLDEVDLGTVYTAPSGTVYRGKQAHEMTQLREHVLEIEKKYETALEVIQLQTQKIKTLEKVGADVDLSSMIDMINQQREVIDNNIIEMNRLQDNMSKLIRHSGMLENEIGMIKNKLGSLRVEPFELRMNPETTVAYPKRHIEWGTERTPIKITLDGGTTDSGYNESVE